VRKKINPDLSELEAVYGDQDNTVTMYDGLDHYAIYSYDGLDRLIKSEWYLSPSASLTETCSYNYLNKIKVKTDSGGNIYSYEYDQKGRLTGLINPDSTFVEAHYDDTTNTVTLFDENQHKKEYSYNWVNQLMQVKEYTDLATYYLTQYIYDSEGNVTSYTDASGNTTSYTYDSLFGVTQIVYPDSTTESYSYDALGNTVQKNDANGVTTLTYDAIYQLVSIEYPDQVINFNYDTNGNRISMTDSEGISTYSYDNRNRLLSETRTIMGDPYTVAYLYDPASNVESITYPDQSVVTYEYDSLNRIVNIPGYAQFTYDTDSLLATATYANGVETTYEYNDCQRLTNLHAQKNGTDLLLMDYSHDAEGNIEQLEYSKRLPDQQWSESVETFAYDWLDRLVSAQGGYGLLSYSYDAVGNRLSKNDVTYSYNSMNELLSVSDGSSFTYDEMGNTLTKSDGTDTWFYTQNKRNELIEVEKNQNLVAEYSYDGDGKRMRKTEWVESLQDYQTKICVYSGQHVIYEKNLDTTQEATYVYGQTGKIAKNSDGLTDFYHSGHLGSTRLITDESGNALTAVDYGPLGKDVETGEKTLYTYNGKEKDETGLYHYGARYYDPEAGRFISRDFVPGQLANPQTLNRYTYCLNNPLKYRDPDGCEQAGALLGKGNYPNLNNLGGPMSWSWAPQNIGKESPGDPGCLLAMLLLSGIAVSPLAVGLAKDIASFGADVVSLVCNVMKGVIKVLSTFLGNDLVKTIVSGMTAERVGVTYIQTLRNILELLEHLAGFWKHVRGFDVWVGVTDSLQLVVMVVFFNAKGEAICGSVAFSNGDRYVWKLVNGVYYVLINGDWVEMPEDWKVGDPLPGEC
jgi:RHS repeat-associated protein